MGRETATGPLATDAQSDALPLYLGEIDELVRAVLSHEI